MSLEAWTQIISGKSRLKNLIYPCSQKSSIRGGAGYEKTEILGIRLLIAKNSIKRALGKKMNNLKNEILEDLIKNIPSDFKES